MLNSDNQSAVNLFVPTEDPDTSIAAGRVTSATVTAWEQAGQVCRLGNGSDGPRHRSVRLQVAAADTENTAITINVWAIVRCDSPPGVNATADSFELAYVGELVATLGDVPGVAGSAVADETFLFADTMVWTDGAWADLMQAVHGAVFAAHSPAGDSPAWMVLGDTGGVYGLIFESDEVGIALAEAYT